MWPASLELRENLEISESDEVIIITILIQFSIVKAPCDLLLKKTKPLVMGHSKGHQIVCLTKVMKEESGWMGKWAA